MDTDIIIANPCAISIQLYENIQDFIKFFRGSYDPDGQLAKLKVVRSWLNAHCGQLKVAGIGVP